VRDCEHQSTSTVLYIFALAKHYTRKTASLNLTVLILLPDNDIPHDVISLKFS